jgi:hypothetical protein
LVGNQNSTGNSSDGITIYVTPPDDQWVIISIDDPADTSLILNQVMRSDGKIIQLGFNAWRTHR